MRNVKAADAVDAARILFVGEEYAIEPYGEERNFAFVRYVLADRSRHCAAFLRGRQLQSVWHHSFRDVEAREKKIADQKAAIDFATERRLEQRAAKAAADLALVQPYKVGDILYNSWGYDQTNVGFFEVVGLTGKRGVILREICQAVVPGSEGFMSERVVAVPGKYAQQATYDEEHRFAGYIDKPPLHKMVANDGSVNIMNASYGYARRWDGNACYQSHYA